MSGNHWDLGSIPRSTQTLVHIFSNVFLYRLPNSEHHIPHASACQVAPKLNPMVRMEVHHILQSTNRHLIQKVNEGLMFLGFRLLTKPHIWAITPPLVCYFLFSFFLFQFVGVKNPRYLFILLQENEEDEGRVPS